MDASSPSFNVISLFAFPDYVGVCIFVYTFFNPLVVVLFVSLTWNSDMFSGQNTYCSIIFYMEITRSRKNEIKNNFKHKGMDDILHQLPVSNLSYFSSAQNQQDYSVVGRNGFS